MCAPPPLNVRARVAATVDRQRAATRAQYAIYFIFVSHLRAKSAQAPAKTAGMGQTGASYVSKASRGNLPTFTRRLAPNGRNAARGLRLPVYAQYSSLSAACHVLSKNRRSVSTATVENREQLPRRIVHSKHCEQTLERAGALAYRGAMGSDAHSAPTQPLKSARRSSPPNALHHPD